MLKRRDIPQPEATPQVQAVVERTPMRSNPSRVQPDFDVILQEIRRDFPLTLARLAE